MLQTNIREEYRITTLEVIELIEDLISYSLSVVSNRSTALITNKFGVASLTKLAILNNANIALVDAVHYSIIKQFPMFRLITKENALMITLIKDDDDLLGTINSHIKLRRLRARYKTKAADSRYAKASRGRTKKDKDLEDSNTSSNVLRLRRRDRAAACAQLAKRKQLGKEAQLKKTRDKEKLAKAKKEKEEKELTDAYILYFKELLSNNSRIFANAIGIGKTQAIVLAVLIEYCDLSDLLALQFCFFSNSLLENIGRLTKEKAIEMRINTTNAISKALAAANKLVALQSYIILEANTPAVHSKATKHCLALLAAQFIIVCSFRKVDKHVFRAYNTISVTAQQTIIRKGSSYIEKRAILLPNILEKEGLNKSEASRRVIFNCFKMQAIASYPALATLKAAYVKDLFTNLSKDYFLVREAHAITKSSLNIAAEDAAKAANTLLPLKEVRAKILIRLYKLIVQAIIVALIAFAEVIILIEATHVLAEMCVSIIYFNLDSKLELKVLGKQDVKITS
ncbi:hypothetical protein HBI24_187550 [Parastagonospora nodorum]|nr:hypothetical protein HBI24_187550 [Parastagonospora nodorum]